MKKLTKLLTAALAVVSLTALTASAVSAASAEERPISVKVNGTAVAFPDQEPVIRNSRTLVPVRFVAESLGCDVDWDPDSRSAVIDGGRIVMYVDSRQAVIDGQNVTLDTAPTLIRNRTMVPLRVIAETLDCTVDWFGTSRMILINRRNSDGSEKSLFERYAQSGLFWRYDTGDNEYLVWKADYATQAEASDPAAYHSWWIERPTDPSTLVNGSFDCSIVMKTFYPEELAQVRDMLYTPYPTRSAEAYELMMQTICGELWENCWQEDSEWYPLYAAMPVTSGTFGTRYLDDREVEMNTGENCTRFTVNLSREGAVNPETPRRLSEDEIRFHTAEAKENYCLSLWGLE